MDETVASTKKVLTAVVKKTPLNDKLLSRPPFRYLHDLIMEIISNTGFASDLFQPQEKDSANVSEKEQKLEFLQKLISFIERESGQKVKAKPSKIIAGLEPEETNAMLQLFAKCAAQHKSSSSNSTSTTAASTKSAQASAKIKSPSGSSANLSSSSSVKQPKSGRGDQGKSTSTAAKKEKQPILKNTSEGLPALPPATSSSLVVSSSIDLSQNVTPLVMASTNTTGTGSVSQSGVDGISAPVVIRDIHAKDQADGQEEDDFVIINANSIVNMHHLNLADMAKDPNQQHGHLVKKILETSSQLSTTNLDGPKIGGRDKERENTKKEIDDLRMFVQQVARDTAPVSSFLDYFQEDVDAMIKEMDLWKFEYSKYAKQLDFERAETDNALQPLKSKSIQVEEQVQEVISKIQEAKAQIFENEQAVQKLMKNLVNIA